MSHTDYIGKISAMSDKYGDKLLALLERYNKIGLREVTTEEAKAFFEELTGGEQGA